MGSGALRGPFFFNADQLSYGMNWQESIVPLGMRKILMLDYQLEVCNVGDMPFDPDEIRPQSTTGPIDQTYWSVGP